MGYLDRQYDDFDTSQRGPIRRFFDRVFENVENPLGWSLKAFAFRGIDVRIHLATIVFVLAYLVGAIRQDAAGIIFIAAAMASLLVVVILHEFGHCFACRAVGGRSNRMVILPFGGLAFTMPPHEWRAHLITTIGGPGVNVAIAAITSLALLAMGKGGAILFDPFNPSYTITQVLTGGSNALAYTRLGVWSFHYINLIILAFNVLLPFFPLDGGRIVHALLWRSGGYRKATETATLIGFAGAGVLAIVALLANEMLLLVIALFGFWSCWVERQRLKADADLAEIGAGPAASGLGTASGATFDDEDAEPAGPSRAEIRHAKREEADAAELDRLLEKIGSSGMGSLSRAERKTLDRLSKKKRQT